MVFLACSPRVAILFAEMAQTFKGHPDLITRWGQLDLRTPTQSNHRNFTDMGMEAQHKKPSFHKNLNLLPSCLNQLWTE